MGLIDKIRRWRKASSQAELFTLNWLSPARRTRNEAWIRSLCQSVYLGGNVSLCRVLGRFKMFVDTRDVGVSSHLMMDGYWEMWLTEALADVVKPGMKMLDIGSNLGYFSLVMAHLAGPEGHVHAFEVNPDLVACARRSAWINGLAANITTHEQALGDVDGAKVIFEIPENEPGGGHVRPAAPDGDMGLVWTTTKRLDSYPELFDFDVIKIDVEGAEEAIWRGMEGMFARGRPLTIFMEFAAARYADPAAFLATIVERGFTLARLDPVAGIELSGSDQILARPPAEDQMLVLRRPEQSG